MPDLSCSTKDLQFSLQHVGSFLVGHVGSNQGWDLEPRHWEHGVLDTGPPGKSQQNHSKCQEAKTHDIVKVNIEEWQLELNVFTKYHSEKITFKLFRKAESTANTKIPNEGSSFKKKFNEASEQSAKETVERKESEVTQSCPTLCDPMDYSLPRSSIHGIFQARLLEWVAISFSRGSSQPRDQTWVSRIVGRHFAVWATKEVFKGESDTS